MIIDHGTSSICTPNFLPESEPVISQFDVIEGDNPEMEIGQCSIREAMEVDLFCTGELFAGWLPDKSRELDTPYSAYTPGFKGDGSCNGRIS